MYSGTTLSHGSGRVIGVHQKIDRVARKHIKRYVGGDLQFPSIKDILHFEGNNGPDGIKRKSPSKDEPWHYIDPANSKDTTLYEIINNHIYNLSQALKTKNRERAEFEASWLAHAVVDGLTPAHHFALDKKIEELWGKPHDERKTIFEKNVIRGNGRIDTISKNWQYWGAKGVFTAHFAFEWGVATAITGHRFASGEPKPAELKRVEKEGFEAIFKETLYRIYDMKFYDEFINEGWTHDLADRVRGVLMPEIIKTVAIAWYYAAHVARSK